jgi:hypothetical protein
MGRLYFFRHVFANKTWFPKSEIDFMQISMFWRFSLKKQSRDQKYVSPLMHLANLFIFMTISHPQHMLWAHQSI